MKSFRAAFQITEDNNCPLYALKDVFVLTEKSICFPKGKESCLILVREMTQLLFQLLGQPENYTKRYTCSGCVGLIKFKQITDGEIIVGNEEEALLSEKEQRLFDKISDYPLLKVIPTNHLKQFISCFKGRKVSSGELLIKKNERIDKLFILLSGTVIVEDGAVPITRLGEGEVCGELSYFGDNRASTSVRAAEDVKALAISGEDFGKLIKISDSVQLYMARLLAERLSRANAARANDFDACMQGRINEMAPAELMQVFHMHQKTGVLNLNMPKGKGCVMFKEGAIVKAMYDDKSDQDAIFSVLVEREGIYSFSTGLPDADMNLKPIGDFMMLLMEGIKRVDEE